MKGADGLCRADHEFRAREYYHAARFVVPSAPVWSSESWVGLYESRRVGTSYSLLGSTLGGG